MQNRKHGCHTINELKSLPNANLTDPKKETREHQDLICLKIGLDKSGDSSYLAKFNEHLKAQDNQKKEKWPNRQEKKSNIISMDTDSFYDESELKEEFRFYFNDLEKIEPTVEKTKKIKEPIISRASKSLKKGIQRAASLLIYELPLETAANHAPARGKFSYKSIINEGVK